VENNNTFLELRREALKQLLIQAKKEHNKPLYKKLMLKLKQISSGEGGGDSDAN